MRRFLAVATVTGLLLGLIATTSAVGAPYGDEIVSYSVTCGATGSDYQAYDFSVTFTHRGAKEVAIYVSVGGAVSRTAAWFHGPGAPITYTGSVTGPPGAATFTFGLYKRQAHAIVPAIVPSTAGPLSCGG